jgi:arachidonate 15-lipoxygenase
MWLIRKSFWNFWGWLKFVGAKPAKIPCPTNTGRLIETVSLSEAAPGIPIKTIRVARRTDIPADERSVVKTLAYQIQVGLYSVWSPMQRGLPPIDSDPAKALRHAYTWPRKATFPPPALPAEFLGIPDLGSLAVRGPYACYTEKDDDGIYKWDLWSLGGYDHHVRLYNLGMRVLFRIDPIRGGLQAFQIDTALGSAGPEDPAWELSKKIALCAVTTHLSLVRHFNWVHLASAAHLAIATRNRLPPEHPVCRLLWPHIYGTQQSNDMVTRGQMAQGGDFESIFSFTFDGMCQLFEETYRAFRFRVNDPEEDAKARRIHDAAFETPTQENLEALFKVMHEHARYYLGLYYAKYPEVTPGASAARPNVRFMILVPPG